MDPKKITDAQDAQAEANMQAATEDITPVEQQLSYPLDYVTQSLINQAVKDYLTTTAIGGLHGFQIFTSSGTFTVPTGYTQFLVKEVGGGQGGQHCNTSATAASPGAGGDYSEKLIDLTNVSTVTVTIGAGGAGGSSGGAAGTAGGDTTFGSYLLAKGGASGSTSTGTLIIPAWSAQIPSITLSSPGSSTNVALLSAAGGSTPFGAGGQGVIGQVGTQASGNNGQGYGSGGSGGASGTAGLTASGGNGANGLVVVIW